MPTFLPPTLRRHRWTRRIAVAVCVALSAAALAGCRPSGPTERVLEPAVPAVNRPVATLGPDDAVAPEPAVAPPHAAIPRTGAAGSPATAGCDTPAAGARHCTPSPRP